MSKHGIGKRTKRQTGNDEGDSDVGSGSTGGSPESHDVDLNGENLSREEIDRDKYISSGESLLRKEDHRRQTQALLQRFENSHFFVRVSESDVPSWSKRSSRDDSRNIHDTIDKSIADRAGTLKTAKKDGTLNAVIDKGYFDARASGISLLVNLFSERRTTDDKRKHCCKDLRILTSLFGFQSRMCHLGLKEVLAMIHVIFMIPLISPLADRAGTLKTAKKDGTLNAVIDKGYFDARASGGLARSAIKCCSLSSGAILVLLKVNVGVDFTRYPVLEIFQFEKHQDKILTTDAQENSYSANQDPCGDLLKWLLPLDNSVPPPSRPLSPPNLSSNSSIRSTSTKSNFSSSGSQLFPFGHFRSYSMSSLPPNSSASAAAAAVSSKSTIDLEDWKQVSSQNYVEPQKTGSQGLLSFRGVPLEPNRFSVRCGLEGIYKPGRRWRRKVDIVQPIEIRTFAADGNTDDLLCVQIKNISPAHLSDIVLYVDAITIVFEEAAKGGSPVSLPIACIEAGDGHSLPNLALRLLTNHWILLHTFCC